MASSPQSAPELPQYRITFFYGPEPVEDRPGCLCCTFNVKKRSWKGGVQIAVEINEREVARAQEAIGFEPWLQRILATLLDAERADYDSRARDLFAQHLCWLKLDLAIEAGLQQENRRIAAEAFVRELDAAAPAHKDRLLAAILSELDVAGYGGV
ncbi:MAG: hypothetical protein ACREI9_06155 [Nitrospiraceae bacterium]